VLQGIVPRGGLEPSGNQVGGVEKRRQALARLERERAGKGSASVHRQRRFPREKRCFPGV
jgi:hypothetical protein